MPLHAVQVIRANRCRPVPSQYGQVLARNRSTVVMLTRPRPLQTWQLDRRDITAKGSLPLPRQYAHSNTVVERSVLGILPGVTKSISSRFRWKIQALFLPDLALRRHVL